MVDTIYLWEQGDAALGMVMILVTVVVGLAAAATGVMIARAI